MLVEIQSIRFDLNQRLNKMIENKFDDVLRLSVGLKRCQVFLRKNNDNSTNTIVIDVKVNTDKKSLFVCGKGESFEKASDVSSLLLKQKLDQLKNH